MDETPVIRVLLVEPSPLQGRVMSELLHNAGMETRWAMDGMEALELLPDFQPHVLLTELVLPFFSGLELIRRCHTLVPELPALVVTAASSDWAMDAAYAAGARFVLLKPTDNGEILRLIRELHGGPEAYLEKLLLAHYPQGHGLGPRQCALCAALLSRDRKALLKELYIEAAAKEKTDWRCVAKNVDRFIKEFWRSGDPGFLGLPDRETPPPVKEFLKALSQAATIPL